MGAGVAKQAKDRCTGIELRLGFRVATYGNNVYVLESDKIISFPTKHHFRDDSDLTLIETGAQELARLSKLYKMNSVVLPRVGCGLGKLEWDTVKPILEKYLDDRFTVVS